MSKASYYRENKERWVVYRQNREAADRPRCAAETLCEGKEFAKGFCKKHYKRWYRSGTLYSPRVLAGLRTPQQRRRDYYLANREALIAKACARRNADPIIARAYERQVYQRRREKAIATTRARERGMKALGSDGLAYGRILRLDPCCYCGGMAEQIDHIAPVADGGENHWTNLTAACWPCNRAKWDKSLLVFLAAKGALL